MKITTIGKKYLFCLLIIPLLVLSFFSLIGGVIPISELTEAIVFSLVEVVASTLVLFLLIRSLFAFFYHQDFTLGLGFYVLALGTIIVSNFIHLFILCFEPYFKVPLICVFLVFIATVFIAIAVYSVFFEYNMLFKITFFLSLIMFAIALVITFFINDFNPPLYIPFLSAVVSIFNTELAGISYAFEVIILIIFIVSIFVSFTITSNEDYEEVAPQVIEDVFTSKDISTDESQALFDAGYLSKEELLKLNQQNIDKK